MAYAPISDDDALKMVTGALAADDYEFKLWPKDLVEHAKFLWTQGRGRVPSLGEVAMEVGEDRAKALLSRIVERRKAINALMGHGSPCHYCAASEALALYDFALMRVDGSNRNWSGMAVSVAVSAATVPLFGAALIRLPGRNYQGAALHLRLVVCRNCRKKHGNFLGIFMLNQSRATNHPLWNHLQSVGFTKFFDSEKIPTEIKLRSLSTL